MRFEKCHRTGVDSLRSHIALPLVAVGCSGGGTVREHADGAGGCSGGSCSRGFACIEGECYLRHLDDDLTNLQPSDAAKDYGEIRIRVFPPESSACTCAEPPGLQTEESLCRWYLGDSLGFRVQVEHVMLPRRSPQDPAGSGTSRSCT
jgi:hypothetical protein